LICQNATEEDIVISCIFIDLHTNLKNDYKVNSSEVHLENDPLEENATDQEKEIDQENVIAIEIEKEIEIEIENAIEIGIEKEKDGTDVPEKDTENDHYQDLDLDLLFEKDRANGKGNETEKEKNPKLAEPLLVNENNLLTNFYLLSTSLPFNFTIITPFVL